MAREGGQFLLTLYNKVLYDKRTEFWSLNSKRRDKVVNFPFTLENYSRDKRIELWSRRSKKHEKVVSFYSRYSKLLYDKRTELGSRSSKRCEKVVNFPFTLENYSHDKRIKFYFAVQKGVRRWSIYSYAIKLLYDKRNNN